MFQIARIRSVQPPSLGVAMSGWTTLRTSILHPIGNLSPLAPAERGAKIRLGGSSKGTRVCKKVNKEERLKGSKKQGMSAVRRESKRKSTIQPPSLCMRCRPVTVAAVVVAATTAVAGDKDDDENDDDDVQYLLSNTFFCKHLVL